MSKALGQGQSAGYTVSPEAEEGGQRDGARIPGGLSCEPRSVCEAQCG